MARVSACPHPGLAHWGLKVYLWVSGQPLWMAGFSCSLYWKMGGGGTPVGQLLAYTTSWWHLDGMTMVQSLGVTVRARDRKTALYPS